uniref:MARVEL domain-containing protein n=1 Tax=Steinernema glaseri TaxID=37863 RepID=A0A1I7ZMR9_9BILA
MQPSRFPQAPPQGEPRGFPRYENRLRSETARRKEFEVMGRVMNVDSGFYRTSQGLLKILEIVLAFLAVLLVSNSYGVYGERSFALLVSFFAFFNSFMILVAKILTLHLHCSQKAWFLTEFMFNLVMALCFVVSGFMMGYLSSAHWAISNPRWQTIPAVAAGTLFVGALVFLLDAFLTVKERRRYTWHPNPNVPNGGLHNRLPS